MVDVGTWLVPLAKADLATTESFTVRQIPTITFATINDPIELVHLLVHEYHHLRLYWSETWFTLVQDKSVLVRAPWRAQLRPASGLLHGLYVFDRVAAIFDRIFDLWGASERGIRRMLMWRSCIQAGVKEAHSPLVRLTPAGVALVESINLDNEITLSGLAKAYPAVYDWSQRAVSEHMSQAGLEDSVHPTYLGV
jgi:uncharacterized protein